MLHVRAWLAAVSGSVSLGQAQCVYSSQASRGSSSEGSLLSPAPPGTALSALAILVSVASYIGYYRVKRNSRLECLIDREELQFDEVRDAAPEECVATAHALASFLSA